MRRLLLLAATSLLFPSPVSSQTLTVTTDLVLWLRGEDAIDAGGGAVATWPDQSGNANDATQSDPARRPLIVPAAIGGRDVVRFDGSDDRLDLATNVFAAASYPLTVFVVAQTTSSDAHILGTGSSSAGFLTSYGSGLMVVGDELALKANNNNVGVFLNDSQTPTDGLPRILAARSQDYQNSTWVNCAFQSSSTALPNPFPYTKSTLGASDGSNIGASRDPLTGDIAEVLVYERALTDTERNSVEQYLADRYGASLCTPGQAYVELNEGMRLFYALGESGTAPRADRIAGQDLSPFPADALGISTVAGAVALAQEVDGPSGYHFFRASSPAMDVSAGSFTWAGWIRLDSFYDSQTLVAKWNVNASPEKEYRVWYNAGTGFFEFDVSGNGFEGSGNSVTVSHPQVLALGTFYLLEAWYDAEAETVNLRVSTQTSRGTAASASWNGGVFFGVADLNLGAHNTCNDAHVDGTVDAVGLWGRALSESESIALWNGRNGFEPTGQGFPIIAVAGQLAPGLGSLCGIGADAVTEDIWAIPCFGGSIHRFAEDGTPLGTISRPGEAANDVDIDVAPVALTMGATAIAQGDVLFVNGEIDEAEIYALDPIGGSLLATLGTAFGVSHVVGGAYHPGRDTFFLVQDQVPGGAPANRVAEIDPLTGAELNSFPVSPDFIVNFGDLDVCAQTGSLLLVSSDETSIGEFTPDGTFAGEHVLPGTVPGLSGIALIGDSGRTWVSTVSGNLVLLDSGVVCLPEPGVTSGLIAGLLQLAALQRMRKRRRARTSPRAS